MQEIMVAAVDNDAIDCKCTKQAAKA